MIQISNHGPLILSTNYWDSELAQAGKLFVSVNAGAIRVLLPPSRYGDLQDMRAGKACVLSRGPWPEQQLAEGIELMWDDGSEAPYALFLTPESFDMLPGEPQGGREWICAVYVAKDGRPHKSLERRCHWRRVERIPCLERGWNSMRSDKSRKDDKDNLESSEPFNRTPADSGHSDASEAKFLRFRLEQEEARCEGYRLQSKRLLHALERSVFLQAHYAKLLNMWDGGHRIVFENAQQWLARLEALERTDDTASLPATSESPDPLG
jgi:hypothetical protein